MHLVSNRKNIPTQWKHNPSLQHNDKWTVAMFLSNNGTAIPPFWNLSK